MLIFSRISLTVWDKKCIFAHEKVIIYKNNVYENNETYTLLPHFFSIYRVKKSPMSIL